MSIQEPQMKTGLEQRLAAYSAIAAAATLAPVMNAEAAIISQTYNVTATPFTAFDLTQDPADQNLGMTFNMLAVDTASGQTWDVGSDVGKTAVPSGFAPTMVVGGKVVSEGDALTEKYVAPEGPYTAGTTDIRAAGMKAAGGVAGIGNPTEVGVATPLSASTAYEDVTGYTAKGKITGSTNDPDKTTKATNKADAGFALPGERNHYGFVLGESLDATTGDLFFGLADVTVDENMIVTLHGISYDDQPVNPEIPVPATLALMVLGAAGLPRLRRRKTH